MTNNKMTKGTVEVYNFDNFKLHIYNTNDVMGDTSLIVEGKDGLVMMELPLFKENAVEFEDYYKSLNKPVVKVVTDYHLGGSEGNALTMPAGMPGFIEGPIYGGMMKHFAEIFGDTMVELPEGDSEEVAFGSVQNWAGVSFDFEHGPASDFPGASIIIGKKIYYTHWAPMKMHPSNLQFSSAAAIDAELAEAERAHKSNCELFVGGHGGAAKMDAVEFKINYVQTMKKAFADCKSADDFVASMKKSFPNLPGEDNLTEVAKVLYQ